MAAYFFDSSAIVKRYVQETGTAWVRRQTRRGPVPIYLARITTVEVTSAVARRRQGGSLTPVRVRSILTRLRDNLADRYFILDLTPTLFDDAMRLANTYALRSGGLDNSVVRAAQPQEASERPRWKLEPRPA